MLGYDVKNFVSLFYMKVGGMLNLMQNDDGIVGLTKQINKNRTTNPSLQYLKTFSNI